MFIVKCKNKNCENFNVEFEIATFHAICGACSQILREETEEEKNLIAQSALDLAALKASAKAKLIAGEPLTAAEADTLVI